MGEVPQERWAVIERLLDQALERAPADRAAFLEQACAGDLALRAEVERLLQATERADDFLKEPAAAYAAPLIERVAEDLAPAPGTRLGAYEIVRELAQGGMATVYLAQDSKHHRPVALKVLRPELGAALGPERFLREIEIAARLTHPNIVPVHDSGEDDGFLYYVMPYVEGESLRDHLRREKQLSVEDALRITREVASALDYAHHHGVIHRDIKPENILLEEGQAVVADFGIARAISAAGEASLTGTGVMVGTPAYMSPEQVSGDIDLDGRSDLYSLGCVLYEMLAGQPPFTGPTIESIVHQHLAAEPRPVTAIRGTVPAPVADAIGRALSKTPADRFATAAQFAEALGAPVAALPFSRQTARFRIALGLGVGLAGLLSIALFSRSRVHVTLDADLVAVAPFDVLAPNQQLWREGLVDVLSRNLDGVGSLRTVSPTLVVRRWKGRADPDGAVQLGRRTGAGLVVFGQIVGAGPDSVRLSVVILDVATKRSLGEIELRQESERMDRLADSATLGLVRELARTRPTGTTRLTSFSEASFPALKAFLQGRQFYRRAAWDSALAYYDRALTLDSTFALALRGVRQVTWWASSVSRPDSRDYALRAGAHNRGLAPRESLLVVADSLLAALDEGPLADSAWWSHERRVFATLEVARTRYPDDPEVWYQLGEARFHFGWYMRIPAQLALEAFDEAIALDSGFAPAYFHSIELALTHRGKAEGARYAKRYVALHPTGAAAQGIDVVARLLDNPAPSFGAADPLLDAGSIDALRGVYETVRRWPDSAETAVRTVVTAKRRAKTADDSVALLPFEAQVLAYRGHLHQVAVVADRLPRFFATLALLGAVPTDSAGRTFSRWPRDWQAFALPFWATRGDGRSIQATGHWADSVGRLGKDAGSRAQARYVAATARGYLALVRHDTTQALRLFETLPDMICPHPFWGVRTSCFSVLLTRAQLLQARGRDADAAKTLEAGFTESTDPLEPIWVLERGRVSEHMGNRAQAIASFQFVVDIWLHADPELQPYVAEARAALKRLGAEPR